MGKQIEALEDKADVLTQTTNQPFLLTQRLTGINGDITHANGAGFRMLQQVDTAQQRGFTGYRWAR